MKKKAHRLITLGMILIFVITLGIGQYKIPVSGNVSPEDPISITAIEKVQAQEITNYFKKIEYIETNNKEEIELYIKECKEYSNQLIILCQQVKKNLDLAEKEIKRINQIQIQYETQLTNILEQEAEEERLRQEELKRQEAEKIQKAKETQKTPIVNNGQYPIATKVWNYMQNNLGWNDYVCAGVMGNLMAETGGQTLNLDPGLYYQSFYGICQWSNKWYPQIQGASLDAQLDFIAQTVKPIIDTYGKNYETGFNYDRFTKMTDSREAALAFAKCYERCNSKYYAVRLDNAVKAYDYFVN